ncbi:aminopeptidase N [Angustibacter aerolatus]
MPALTRQEAVERRALLDVTQVDVDLDLWGADAVELTDVECTSTTTIRFTCTRPGASTFVDVKPVRLLEVTLGGEPLDVSALDDGRLPLTGLQASNELVVRAVFACSHTGEGLHRFVDPQDDGVYLYTQAFLDDAPRFLACFDQPDLKAEWQLSITAPPHWVVLANTRGRSTAPGRWVFDRTKPLPPYLVALAAGDYEGVREQHDGIDVGVWARRSMVGFLPTERMLETTRRGLDWFHGLFGVRYPFGKYDQVMVPEFNAGAMENPGLVTFRDEHYLPRGAVTEEDRLELASTQLHEMAHMWFGDLVTMRWWDDLWLNESFAEYLGYRAAAEADGFDTAWTTFLVRRKVWGYHADRLSTTHPVAPEAVDDTAAALQNFDGISYAKGASALRQLAEWLGDEAFFGAVREHFRRHAYGNATLADLVAELTRTSGRDVGTWADQWLRTSGTSTLTARTETGDDGRWTAFSVHQQSPGRDRPHRLGIGLHDRVDGRLVRRALLAVEVDAAAVTPVPALVGEPAADVVLVNDGDLTFAATPPDPMSRAALLDDPTGLDPLARALVWTSLWELVQDGDLAPSAYADTVVRRLGDADADATLGSVLRHALQALVWAQPANRAYVAGRPAAPALAAARDVGADHDGRLTWARAWLQVTEDAQALQRLLDGEPLGDGLHLDVELRWRVVRRVAALGAADVALVAAELRRDRSSGAALHARAARAAVPSAVAKASAWADAVGGRLSNHELEATGRGFWQLGQDDLLASYAGRYETEYPPLAGRSSAQVTDTFGRLLFPAQRVEPGTVDLAERLLAGDLGTTARRVVTECRDDATVALRARAAD